MDASLDFNFRAKMFDKRSRKSREDIRRQQKIAIMRFVGQSAGICRVKVKCFDFLPYSINLRAMFGKAHFV